ncbi:acyltransferase [Lampropedia cohaerens]|uniref:L-ornithine N(alpha)-acyltransferase n=1 Tax=Lampropedia cohaerens TaxID=1610491 RepID=A0A0U1PX25_9BURK|nr:lysophospholipid acyltransferase family protein [Lampropedia cohaerens]KKW67088.1 acyltransferase [Lampropedia cohaerens]
MFSVDHVLQSRFPQLSQRSPRAYGTLLTLLRFVFRESEFESFAQRYPHLRGFDFVEQVLDHFGFATAVTDRDRERIPAWGRVVIIANHPIGSLDGLALLKMVGQVRRDVRVVANDMLQHLAPLQQLLLPVNNMGGSTAHEHLRAIDAHLQANGAVIIFPAGEVSRISPKGVRDGRWNAGFLRFARRAQAPILPICIEAHNSVFFYALSMLAKPLSTLWLVREMFKHANDTVQVRIGLPIPFAQYRTLPGTLPDQVKLFKHHVYRVGKGRSAAPFRSMPESVAHPEARQALREALRQCELLGTTREGLHIRLFQYEQDSCILRELGRLREISFRAVGEGTGRKRDIDHFDALYEHLVLWDDEALEIVGAYRLRRIAQEQEQEQERAAAAPAGAAATVRHLSAALYSSTLFEYHEQALPVLQQGLELGRSFVQPRYWRQNGLDLLWRGIGAYLQRHPQLRYLLGPVTLSAQFPPWAQSALIGFYRHHWPAQTPLATARVPYQPPQDVCPVDWAATDSRSGLQQLKLQLAQAGLAIPPLFKQYSEVSEPGGTQFVAFGRDAAFGNCIDALVVVDLHRLKASRRKRYLGDDADDRAASAHTA